MEYACLSITSYLIRVNAAISCCVLVLPTIIICVVLVYLSWFQYVYLSEFQYVDLSWFQYVDDCDYAF